MTNKIESAGQFFLLTFLVIGSSMGASVYINDIINPSNTKLTMHHSEILTNHNQRLNSLEAQSGSIDLDANNEMLRDGFQYKLDQMEKSAVAKIYTIEITICKMNAVRNELQKRTVIMKNLLAFNPSVTNTAIVVDTGLSYGSNVEIPTIMDDEEEYACDLKVLSVR